MHNLHRYCNFKAGTAEQYREETIHDTFTNGIASPLIHQHLLENKTLDLESAYNQTFTLGLAQFNAESYAVASPAARTAALAPETQMQVVEEMKQQPRGEKPETVLSGNSTVAAASGLRKKCYFCGNVYHIRSKCPPRDVTCKKCKKRRHCAKVCSQIH